MLTFSDLPRIREEFPPSTPVVYRLYDADGRLMYVGLTSNVYTRLKDHWAVNDASGSLRFHILRENPMSEHDSDLLDTLWAAALRAPIPQLVKKHIRSILGVWTICIETHKTRDAASIAETAARRTELPHFNTKS